MDSIRSKWDLFWRSPGLPSSIAAGSSALLLAWWLRKFPDHPDPSLYAELQLTCGILAFTYAAIALVRFRGTRERLPLILACGFAIVGFALASSSLVFIHPSPAGYDVNLRDPMAWVISRTLLAVLLVAGLVVERSFPKARNPGREITWALAVVVLLTSLLSATHWQLPAVVVVQPGGAIPRPGNLFPAALFLLAAIGYHSRQLKSRTVFDCSLYFSAVLNVACCLAASQSDHTFDVPFAFAEILQFGSYAVLLGGALFDNAQLFENIRELAVSDSLTGLANHRRLVEELGNEIERAKRTGSQFALMLFDLDELKKINDQYGHLVGTRAICRVANALRIHSRAIDTAARQGGDEFALVLPETGGKGAQEAGLRVCNRVSADEEIPRISVSAGIAVYPQDGQTIEALLGAADEALYKMKRRATAARHLTRAKAV
jgi:diguanylate cyclase (GGDEF)-like protein